MTNGGVETGTICSLVYDIPNKKISTLLAFSQGHWEHAEEAHGDKRNARDLERWRGLAGIGKQSMYFRSMRGKKPVLTVGDSGSIYVE